MRIALYLYPAGSPAVVHAGDPLRAYQSVAWAPPSYSLLLRRVSPGDPGTGRPSRGQGPAARG